MAGVSSTIRVNDGMSPALRSMNKALNIVLSSFEKMQSLSGNSINTVDIASARTELNNVSVALQKVEDGFEQASNKQDKFTDKVKESDSAMSGLVKKIGGAVAAYASLQTAGQIVDLSDQVTQTDSRLNLIVDKEAGESVDQLKAKIMDTANASRSSYLETSKVVAAFAQRAGDAFNGNDEVLAFTETLNKMYVVAGASAEEQASSMLQLTQALGSGTLRGEEFNAVFEAAPNVMQAVADYMNIPIGKLRSYAEEGMISAEIVKNAMFSAAEQTNKDFGSMNMTWQQVMTLMQNKALVAFDPVLKKINELSNNKDVQNFALGLGNAVAFIGTTILWVFELVSGVGGFIADNWSVIAPIITGIATALGLYTMALIAHNVVQGISNALEAISTVNKYVHAKAVLANASAYSAQTVATASATVAQAGFNTALFACPIVWIILAIIALIAIIFTLASYIAKTSDVASSAFGVISGGVMVIISFFKNLGLTVANIALGIGKAISAVGMNIMTAFHNAISSVQSFWYNLLSTVLTVIGKIAAALNKLPFVEFDYSGLTSAADDYAAKAAEAAENKMEYESIGDAFNKGMNTFDTFEKGWAKDAFNKGAEWGDGVSDKVSKKLDSLKKLGKTGETATKQGANIPQAKPFDKSMLGDTKKTADNTGKMADAMEITDEDIKYLRDIAEKEAVNKFTTASIKVDMQNNNTIGNNMDIDGIVSQLESKLQESMERAAEGVH